MAAVAASGINQSAIWHPPAEYRGQVLTACSQAGDRFGPCFSDEMKKAGASSQAIAFTNLLHGDAYLSAFRPVGPVSVGAVNYPFRANENDGLLLVNGDPVLVDIDQTEDLPQDQLKSDPDFQALAAASRATLWPGDRSSPDNLLAVTFPDGSQRFIADYRVQEGCHACAVLGEAFFAFRFDRLGKYTGAEFSGFTKNFAPNSPHRQMMARLGAGQTFTLVLPSNASTGYRWKLSTEPASEVVQGLDHSYSQGDSSLPGAGGAERWTFRTKSRGQATLGFAYVRPGEKSPATPTSIDVVVKVT